MTKYDLVILTGWSAVGGSTEAYINLTNALNKNGVDTILLGPHDWHLDKCNGAMLARTFTDWTVGTVLWHFLPYFNSGKLWKDTTHILSCHETSINPVFQRYQDPISNGVFDKFHFVSEWQLDWQLNQGNTPRSNDMIVIPNLLDPTLQSNSTEIEGKVGGVIGSIDPNKQTHISISKALADGCDTVNVFGGISNHAYFETMVQPLIDGKSVVYHGVVDDKSAMYSILTDVYHYSLSETWGYIQAECDYLNISVHSPIENRTLGVSSSSIVDAWIKEL